MRVVAAVHSDDGGPCLFGEVVRERGHELVEWRPAETPPPQDADAVLVFGGSMHVDQEHTHPWLRDERDWLASLLDRRVPTLGVCLGAEMLANAAGWHVAPMARPEIGWHDVELTPAAPADPVLAGAPARFPAFQWHSYAVSPPEGASVLAVNPACAQAYRVAERAWGIQFHAEVDAATVEQWLEDGADGDDAREVALDAGGVRERTWREIAAWNELGRGLCGRFLELAEA
ncbi:MAG TPA: type 1 glutamine amidotransferase [Thermoleophilaceae bacterium]